MTMPRKGSRPVHVDGATYRFMVRDEGHNQETLRVVVEPEAYPGHVFIATFGRHLLDPIGIPQAATLVRYALKVGWAPAAMSNFVLGETDILDMLGSVVQR